MRDLVNCTLETQRLIIEPVSSAHADEAWEGLRDPRLWTHFPDLAPKTLDDLKMRYARWASPGAGSESGEIWANWVCRKKTTGKLVGALQATIHAPQSAYVAYMIYANDQRKGYAKEAMTALVAHLRDRLHLRRLYAEIAPGNSASIRLIQALGFTPAAGLDSTWRLLL